MITLREGDKRDIAVSVTRARGTGDWDLVSPQYRILNATRATTLVAWSDASWDSDVATLSCLFDSTLAALNTPGIYRVQLKGTIGTEVYLAEIKVQLLESGP